MKRAADPMKARLNHRPRPPATRRLLWCAILLMACVIYLHSWHERNPGGHSSALLIGCVSEVASSEPMIDTTYRGVHTLVFFSPEGFTKVDSRIGSCATPLGFKKFSHLPNTAFYDLDSDHITITDPNFAKFDPTKGMVSLEPWFSVRYPEGLVAIVVEQKAKSGIASRMPLPLKGVAQSLGL